MRIRSGKKTGLNRKIRPAASSSQLPWAWWWDTTGSRTGWDLDFGHIPAFFFKTPRASLRRCFFLPIFSVLDFQLFQFLQWFPWCFLFFFSIWSMVFPWCVSNVFPPSGLPFGGLQWKSAAVQDLRFEQEMQDILLQRLHQSRGRLVVVDRWAFFWAWNYWETCDVLNVGWVFVVFHEIYWMFMEISPMDLVIYCDIPICLLVMRFQNVFWAHVSSF